MEQAQEGIQKGANSNIEYSRLPGKSQRGQERQYQKRDTATEGENDLPTTSSIDWGGKKEERVTQNFFMVGTIECLRKGGEFSRSVYR